MLKKSKYVWYIEPLNDVTNITLAGQLPEENFLSGALTSDGTRRHLWRCDFAVVVAFQNAQFRNGLQFRVFNRKGHGQIRQCRFFKRKRGTKAPIQSIPPS